MSYIQTTVRVFCDFCSEIVKVSLDNTRFSLHGETGKDRFLSFTLAVTDAGCFFKDGDLYACDACYTRALRATEEGDTNGTLCREGMNEEETIYAWLDENSPRANVW